MRGLLWLVLLAACERRSDKFCNANPDQCDPVDAPVGPACTTDEQCAANQNGLPLCIDMTACGACRGDVDCLSPTAAICDLAQHTCHGCTTDDECTSKVCTGSGACAATSEVAYIGGPNASGDACTLLAPCATLEQALALSPAPPFIRLLGEVFESNTVEINGIAVDIRGGGARLGFDVEAIGLHVRGGASVTVRDLEITHRNTSPTQNNDCVYMDGATSMLTVAHAFIHDCAGADAIDASGGTIRVSGSELAANALGIEAVNGTVVALSHTVIHDNTLYGIYVNSTGTPLPTTTIDACVIAQNGGMVSTSGPLPGGLGLGVTGALAMTNTIITNNGGPNAGSGGMELLARGPSTLEFVTIADNYSQGSARGITCLNTSTSTFSITNSIVARNSVTGCIPTYSLLDAVGTGTGNKLGDPNFNSPITDPKDPLYYRIKPGSAAIDSASPSASVTRDIDAAVRPGGAADDLGADELNP